MRRGLAAGNWKMNGTAAALPELRKLAESHENPGCDVLICPPATLLSRATEALSGSAIALGAQDCHAETSGAHTGDLSVEMLRDAGAAYVILGHSERRADHGESDAAVRAKTEAAQTGGLTAITCLGESLEEREADRALQVITAQFDGSLPDRIDPARLVLAYEPVWAIGTGRVPEPDQIAEVHDTLRTLLTRRYGEEAAQAVRLLYGGSVKGSNAAEIFALANVDGALVGGASLTAEDFSPIISALEARAG